MEAQRRWEGEEGPFRLLLGKEGVRVIMTSGTCFFDHVSFIVYRRE